MKSIRLLTRLARFNLAEHAFASSLFAILGGQAAAGGVAFLTEILYARLLGPAARGIISLSSISLAFGTLVGGLGIEGVIVYWASRFKKPNLAWMPAVLFWGSLGIFLASALWYFAFWKFRFPFLKEISSSCTRAIFASIPAAMVFIYAMALAAGTEQFRLRSISAVLRQIGGTLSFFVLLLFLGRTPEAALWGNFVGLVIGTIVAFCLLRDQLAGSWSARHAFRHLKPTLFYGLRGQVGNLATFFNYRLDVFFVSYFLNASQLGFYALGVVLSETLWQIPQAVAAALFPRTARQINQDATTFSCFILRQVLLITTVGGVLLAVLSPLLIPIVFGARFKPSVAVIWWILPGTIALAFGKVACADLAGRGKNGYGSAFAFVSFAATGILDWSLIPRMGILGAALASSVAYFVDALLILFALRYELGVTWTSLVVPTKTDLQVYSVLWLRLRSAISATLAPAVQSDATLTSQEDG